MYTQEGGILAPMVLSCKEVAAEIKNYVKVGIEEQLSNGRAPRLVIINTYPTEASRAYTKGKIKDCLEVGINAKLIEVETPTLLDVKKLILKEAETADGIILQLPLHPDLESYKKEILSTIPYRLDVDGIRDNSPYIPATPDGIYCHLLKNNIGLSGKSVVVYGRSEIVGKPFAKLAMEKGATTTICHSKTPRELALKCLEHADIIVCATGTELFTDVELAERLKSDAIVYDVGIRRTEEGLKGDIVHTGIHGINVTPVPGGVGLLTRAGLLLNVFTGWLESRLEATVRVN